MSKPIEITAEFKYERQRFANADGDVIVGEAHANGSINGPIVIKGPAEIDELRRGHSYRFYGGWVPYKNKRTGEVEQQFNFTSLVAAAPHTREGIIAYLRRAGQGFHFGPARAAAMWDAFGGDAVRVLREEPDKAAAELAKQRLFIAPDQLALLTAELCRNQALEACTIELTNLLAGHHFPKSIIRSVIHAWGNKAAEFIRRNPFLLRHFRNCGFKKCDRLYSSLGLPLGRLKRQALAAVYAIESNRDGHVWFPRNVAIMGIRSTVSGADLQIDRAISLAVRAGLLREQRTAGPAGPITSDGDCHWLALAEHADRESRLAESIARKMAEPFAWPAIDSIENIDGEQPAVLLECLQGAIGILGGRPGSGKTHTTANLIKAAIANLGDGEVWIGAPTNLAAQRLSEGLERYQVPVRARTWHSLLGKPEPEQVRNGERWRFNRNNPFPCKLLVGDEESMKDLEIADAVFEATAIGTQMLLVGDVRQLLPVGAGAPLRDMIAAGLPYGELKQIRRNSGGIVEACSAIADGLPWGAGDNLDIIQIDDEERQAQEVLRQLARMEGEGLDPVWDSRVIVARNDTRRAINKLLQVELNSNPGISGSPFKLADKVICRENKDFTIVSVDADDPDTEMSETGKEVRVNNGEIGRVCEVNEKYFVIEVLSPRRVVKVPRGKVEEAAADDEGQGGDANKPDKTGTGCAFDLAYGITYHSSQGAEFPWAIITANPGDGRMGCRELLYTGISRGQVRSVLIGRKARFDSMCRRVALGQRKTLLKELILLNRAKLELEDL